jgi:cytochrome c553
MRRWGGWVAALASLGAVAALAASAGSSADRAETFRPPGAEVTHSRSDLGDLYRAVDWAPSRHPTPPAIVMRGRAPGAMACGYCHLPNGQGRPENAALAGLPAAYIEAQVKAFHSGARRPEDPHYVPTQLMIQVANAVTDAQLRQAAAYFAQRPFVPRSHVVEALTIPAVVPEMGMYRLKPGGGQEALGLRLVEVPDDAKRFEWRDDQVTFTAYVPPGAIARGRALAGRLACASCHGASLQGGPAATAPPIAGRPPTYLLRQIHALRAGVRTDPAAAPMRAVAAGLGDGDMVDLAAYVGEAR